ncbi:hypothetical protein P153DRAFT_336326 [Dothidotthia symphoricarpi CBS 119687]|uniref:ubiquitinyl hydrolase 1 n=1 Tax=Dothidotthia symphoricarpi CBS 119687 TaxID=1392245 RepID=A0A6A6AMN0_9PLEO|nr:uncharacterized protein P153DRAFT_336326 [Dothidotthia symphoricarpi CBS 119687]KAF2131741.1 hypothetical protein P153DRAFT_336326 [Dothidotthia symphoricarpi CBS 119687]
MAPSSGQPPSVEATTYLINHVVLPPALPQADDFRPSNDRHLVEQTLQALHDLENIVQEDEVKVVIGAISMINNLLSTQDSHGVVSESRLQAVFAKLIDGPIGVVAPIEVKAQNAGILVSRSADYITFEFFELSPTNEAAMKTKGRLVRTFPASASRISLTTMREDGLVTSLAQTVAKMAVQAVHGFRPQITGPGYTQDDPHDTADPDLVTDLLQTIITALGEKEDVISITKNTRDETLWKDCKRPWRRSALWLFVRVSLQAFFSRNAPNKRSPDSLYKAFMILFLTRLLDDENLKGLDSDVIYTVSAKLTRRLRKFEALQQFESLQPHWALSVHLALIAAHSFIHEKWNAAVESTEANIDFTFLENLQPEADLDIKLPDLNAFVSGMAARRRSAANPGFKPASEFPDLLPNAIPDGISASSDYKSFHLAALEGWIEHNLQNWLSLHERDTTTCGKLRRLMTTYHCAASEAYAGIPISTSVMYLIILELWVACDKSACSIYPLLAKFDPEICMAELQCLLLPLKGQMERLHEIEKHVHSRISGSTKKSPSLYRDFGDKTSFAVRYFNQSHEHQSLKANIERDATEQREQKCEELMKLKSDYEQLMRRYNDSECAFMENGIPVDNSIKIHSPSCSRCAFKTRAEALDIDIHEWPLPKEEHTAKATVFELNIPEAFSEWRDCSAYLIINVLEFLDKKPRKPQSTYALDRHQGLSQTLSSHYEEQRIIIVSAIKPHTGNYRAKQNGLLNITDADVCLDSALVYDYYDKQRNTFSVPLKPPEDFPQKCRYSMPDHSKALKRFMYRPSSAPDGVAPNEVISGVSDCPPRFSVDEFKAIAAMGLGRHIFYSNLLSQLAMPTVDFAKVETHCMILQTVYQVGPPNRSVERGAHENFNDELFCNAMLNQLQDNLGRLTKNWESWRSLSIFVILARRTLSLSSSTGIHQRALEYLAEVRRVCMEWFYHLHQRIASSLDDEQRCELNSRATEIALLCTDTFDVEEVHLDVVLQQEFAISMLLQCSIAVQENQRTVKPESESLYNATLQDWRRLMYRVFPKLRENILRDNTGLDQAVLATWAAFQRTPGTSWASLNQSQGHWLCVTSGQLPVHLNLLTAELLVNGLPLTRLPSEYLLHEMYTPLFQKSALDVVPSDEPGMHFSGKSTFRGQKIHFGMRGSDLLVVALANGRRFDLLPPRLFEHRLPHAFVSDFIHWYDHNNNEILFRPREHPWISDDSNTGWCLKLRDSSWRLVKDSKELVGMTSETARVITRILSAVETPMYIHTMLDNTSARTRVQVQLPRLRLDFYFTPGERRLYSRQYRGMIVDNDQRTDTLIGLSSKLVLKHEDENLAHQRMLLVPAPRGFEKEKVQYAKLSSPNRMSIVINKDHIAKVHVYLLDSILGRVQDNGDLQSKLLLIYLHALTSHCLPDPLTGFTGTESALTILKSEAVGSFQDLTTTDTECMVQIARLSPGRSFHPSQEKKMQQITWDLNLSSLSQHTQFHTVVTVLLDQARKMNIFSLNSFIEPKGLPSIKLHLQEREAIRCSSFRVFGFGAESFTTTEDSKYNARDSRNDPEKAERAFVAATMIFRDQAALHSAIPNFRDVLLQTHFDFTTQKDFTTITGVSDPVVEVSLQFDPMWLDCLTPLLKEYWCTLHQSLANLSQKYNKFDILVWLSTLAYAKSADMDTVQALGAMYRLPDLATPQIPSASSFDLSHGHTFNVQQIQLIAKRHAVPFRSCPEYSIPMMADETNRKYGYRRRGAYQRSQNHALRTLLESVSKQWPQKVPTTPASTIINTYFYTSAAMREIADRFKAWHDNRRFHKYLQSVSNILAGLGTLEISVPQTDGMPLMEKHTMDAEDRHASMRTVFASPAPEKSQARNYLCSLLTNSTAFEPDVPTIEQLSHPSTLHTKRRLMLLCESLDTCARSNCEKDYVESLRDSCRSLDSLSGGTEVQSIMSGGETENLLREYRDECDEHYQNLSDALTDAVENSSEGIAFRIQQCPRISPTFWLSYLHRERFNTLPEIWKNAIVEYAIAITHLHRAQRLMALGHKPVELAEELRHVGHTNWNPRDFPETLLFEAESSSMIREVQEAIAGMMRNPPDDDNTLYQLNMGAGKSSTIVPIVAAALADKRRVIVNKAQSKQMLQMLISRLGGLLSRRVWSMPFSRNLKLLPTDAKKIRDMYQECMDTQGILLVLPENLLSFKLMGIESLLAEKNETAQSLLETQEFLEEVSRDIVDESDEVFNTRNELVYTMGAQRPIDFAPERWLIIQGILGYIPRFAEKVQENSPLSIEIHSEGRGKFPRIRLLRSDAGDQLFDLLAKHLVDRGMLGLASISNQAPELRDAVFRYITQIDPSKEDVELVENSGIWTNSTKLPLLHVRGLIGGGVLRFILERKRWRVDFGLDSSRTPSTKLAVPFKSKDSPSQRSEFSHPDVVLLLTQLSFYYGGLSNAEMFDIITHLLRSDQSVMQYNEWVKTASSDLPRAFRNLSGINIKDRMQCVEELFPYLRYSRAAIDYFLNHLVFPKEMREYPERISASGWDLGAKKANPTTGFSGTADTSHVLPLDVKHLNLPSQSHTNALVLQHLLQPETEIKLLAQRTASTDADHLLEAVNTAGSEIRVILDVGANVLEFDNTQFAERWLSMRKNDRTQAVVFFKEEESSVLDVSGRIEPLQTSPFAKQLDLCLVYLDEAHTRGTDLKLPRDFRAAVTLGANLTKDRLVQASMRLRQLGKGQSVVFVVSQEIETKIRERMRKSLDDPIDVIDILCWSIGETWTDLSRSMPLWATQGRRFENNKHLWNGTETTREQASTLVEDESQGIELRYKPRAQENDSTSQLEGWNMSNANIAEIVQRCRNFEASSSSLGSFQEEQERELAPQNQEERQLEPPVSLAADKHKLHADLEKLARTGAFKQSSRAFEPAFQILRNTSAASLFDLKQFPTNLLVTADFVRTVKIPSGVKKADFISDGYQRPIQWILSVPGPESIRSLMIISPYEANELLPIIRRTKKVTLHLYAPRSNIAFSSLDSLDLYNVGRDFTPDSVSRSLTVQLNLFAGNLYLRSFAEYRELCDCLGLLNGPSEEGQQVAVDGFITPPTGSWGLKKSPVPFLRALLMKIRREGQGVERTHIGKILSGLKLEESDFETDA